ncbi:MAG: hypothetical protein QOD92_1053 [Acidimicrobiaceae bacterium]|jgi:hypothetical protein
MIVALLFAMFAAMLPDPRSDPFLSVEAAGKLCGLGRSKAYEQARRYIDSNGAEGLPAVEFGRTIRVVTAGLWKIAGLEPPGEPDTRTAPEADHPGGEVLSLPTAATAKGSARGSD